MDRPRGDLFFHGLRQLGVTPMTVAIIPARGGSKRVPNKNLQKIAGKTLVEHALATVHQITVAYPDLEMVVSTDDDEVEGEVDRLNSRYQDWQVNVHRRSMSAGDQPINRVVREMCLDGYCEIAETILLVEPSCPMRTAIHLVAALSLGKGVKQLDGTVTTCHRGPGHTWVRNGAAWVWRAERSGPFLVTETRPLIDIDTPEDLERCRAIMEGRPETVEHHSVCWSSHRALCVPQDHAP